MKTQFSYLYSILHFYWFQSILNHTQNSPEYTRTDIRFFSKISFWPDIFFKCKNIYSSSFNEMNKFVLFTKYFFLSKDSVSLSTLLPLLIKGRKNGSDTASVGQVSRIIQRLQRGLCFYPVLILCRQMMNLTKKQCLS